MEPQARETAGLTTRLIVKYVRQRTGDPGVAEMLRRAGEERPVLVLEDERSWTSYERKIALLEAAAEVCGAPDIGWLVGRTVLAAKVGLPVRMLLWALGTPAQVFRNVARAGPKFTTVSALECIEVGAAHAVVASTLSPGYTPHRMDCDYTKGLLAQIPVLFGSPEGRIAHHECQARGAERCIYRVTWRRQRPWPIGARRRRVQQLELELLTLTEQVESLQLATAGLVASADVEGTLDQIAARAGSAVRAGAYVLAVRPVAGAVPWVRSEGLSDAAANELAADLLGDALPERHDRVVAEVRSARRFYGRLAAVYPGGQSFFPEEQPLLAAYGSLAATALDAAAAGETSRVLLRLARSLADVTTVDDVCERLVQAVPTLVGTSQAAVALWDTARRVVEVRALAGFGPLTDAVRSLAIGLDDIAAMLGLVDDPVIQVHDVETADPVTRMLLERAGISSATVVPILRLGELLGTIVVGWPHDAGPLDELVEERLRGLAAQAATALDNARLLERTAHRAFHDPLTGLPNRLLLQDRFDQATARARREDSAVGLLLLDLDDFKQVNDRFGHGGGDVVLREVATRLTGLLREMDTAVRLGGDEFVVICQDLHEPREAEELARRVGDALALPFLVDGQEVGTAASVGWTLADGTRSNIEELLASADREMYRTKHRRPKPDGGQ